uniref:Ammonium transporter AmtB-like domain-containing protein n=1 Tax=Pelusios castaneus TaxID=367368 RepID=A0A8C8SZ55_9SAUR
MSDVKDNSETVIVSRFDCSIDNLFLGVLCHAAFQDVNVMVIFGFGFLLAFLKRYGFSSTGFNLLIAALGVQWAVLVEGFLFHFSAGDMKISLHSILKAIISVTAVLISAGALLGKANPIQLIWMALVEVAAFSTSRWINVKFLKVEEHTSLMHVHIFGTYFGLAASWWLHRSSLSNRVEKEKSNPISDLFSMLGILFLWMFWPSFNSVLIMDVMQKRNAISNTYYAIAVSAVAAFALSALSSRNGKIRMVHIHHATLAGGVALGFSAPNIPCPWIAMILGLLASVISVLGSHCLQTYLNPVLKIHDSCGVHNTFGLPGLLGAIANVILFIIIKWASLSSLAYLALIEVASFSLTIAIGLGSGFITGQYGKALCKFFLIFSEHVLCDCITSAVTAVFPGLLPLLVPRYCADCSKNIHVGRGFAAAGNTVMGLPSVQH